MKLWRAVIRHEICLVAESAEAAVQAGYDHAIDEIPEAVDVYPIVEEADIPDGWRDALPYYNADTDDSRTCEELIRDGLAPAQTVRVRKVVEETLRRLESRSLDDPEDRKATADELVKALTPLLTEEA